ncbi:acyl-CoA dehydrogenase family protein [Corynebacterium lipophiloflavum]|uniref:acyl-CoA oxidase n=1 Tax=Corynebacterium lipophiloflavum (strain ATCC 700352 / DSM 44291 / CCUG 37336 / JCM 10383 / DMMZ 1944) TaxID=525263 RepID=C0XRW1_CORLD|nr:acyl-CoA dehydrogenase family protein [Corynebacterium lipophiloflavum]EEI17052.1 acyl-CoA dehydrogenase, middle domain protein [Corynebacterium lipophiloflavum DSM 44291]
MSLPNPPKEDVKDAKHLATDTTKASGRPEKNQPERLPATPDSNAVQDLADVLDGNYKDRKESLRPLLNDASLLPKIDGTLDEIRADNLENVQKIASSGKIQPSFSPLNGGEGQVAAGVSSLELIAQINNSAAIKSGVQFGLWGGAVDALGTERHVEFAQGAMDLTKLGCFAMTEIGHGSNVQQLETTATYDPETKEFIVNSPTPGSKKAYIGNAARDGRWAAVFAQLYTPDSEESHGVHCIIVRIREEDGSDAPGVTTSDHGHKGGLLGVDNGMIVFDNVRVPRENLLNRFGDVAEDGTYSSPIESKNRRFFTMLATLVRGRLGVGASALGASRTGLALAVKYANIRRQFEAGTPGKEARLIDYRQHRRRLLIPLAKSYALAIFQNALLDRYQAQQDAIMAGEWNPAQPTDEQERAGREMETLAAIFKSTAATYANATLQECREACGGAGYMSENLLTTFRADVDIFTTFEGDDTILRQLVGKNLLTAYGREVSEMSPFGMAKFVASNVGDILTRRSGIAAGVQSISDRVTGTGSLFDADTQLRIVQAREEHVLNSLVRRVQVARKMDREDAAKVIDRAQDHLLAAAVAYGDRMMVQAMIEAEEKLPENSPARPVFEQLRDLYVLDTIVEHADWYQEHGVLPSGRVKAAKAAVNDLVDSLGPWSEVLVDAFKIPQVVLDRPMMSNGGTDLS